MWKLFFSPATHTPTVPGRKLPKNSIAGVGAIALLFWCYYFTLLLYSAYQQVLALVLLHTCCILISFVSFLLNTRQHTGAAVFLMNANTAFYCITTLFLLGWESGAQWSLTCAILSCLIIYPISRLWKIAYCSLLCMVMLLCYLLSFRHMPPPTEVNLPIVTLINIAFVLLGNILIVEYNMMGSSLIERYYKQQIHTLSSDAYIDELTGLWNRRYAMERLNYLAVSKDFSVFSLAMLDVDFFKRINDTYGHNNGDIVLKQLSHMILDQFRSTDIAVRWGGEEFLIVLCGVNSHQSQPLLERLRQAVADTPFLLKGKTEHVHITVGIADYIPGMDLSQAIEQSDTALYYGKRHGRNQVVLYSDLVAHPGPHPVSET